MSLGRIQIPPMQAFFALTDRADGTIWYLSHRSTDNRISITDTLPTVFLQAHIIIFGQYDGPFLIDKPKLRLFVRGGRLGYEVANLGNMIRDIDNQRILSRKKYQQYGLEIWEDGWISPGDTLGYRLHYGTAGAADV